MTGTQTSNIPQRGLKLVAKTKRKKRKMSKINITDNLIKVVSESEKDILSISVLKLQDNLTEETLKAQLGSTVSDVEADLQNSVEEAEYNIELEVDWADVLEAFKSEENKYSKIFSQVKDVLEKVEGIEAETVSKSVELFATALTHSSNAIFESFDAAVQDETDAKLESLVLEQEEYIEAQYSEAAREWVSEKKDLIEKGELSVKMDSIFAGLKGLFVEHEISLDEEVTKKVQAVETENTELKTQLEEANTKVRALQADSVTESKGKVLATVSEGLSDVDKNKLKELSEPVKFIDEESYSKKLNDLKESFVVTKPKAKTEEEPIVESAEEKEKVKSNFNTLFATFNK